MLTIPNVAPVTFTREINLGASGGTLICAKNGANSSVFSGSITGVGFLNIYNSYLYINGTSNTYSGGTYLYSGDRVWLAGNSSLGAGPVYMATNGTSTNCLAGDVLIAQGATNLANNRLVMLASDAMLQVRGNGLVAQVASIEGVGMVELGYPGYAGGIQVPPALPGRPRSIQATARWEARPRSPRADRSPATASSMPA